jgi:transcriptional regulator with XRE-family HTH domain
MEIAFASPSRHRVQMAVIFDHAPLMREHAQPLALETPGQRLTRARKLRGLTQEGLAEAAAIDRVSIARWETGGRPLPGSRIRQLATALNVQPSWLEYGTGGGPVTLPVLGYVGAAQEVYPLSDGETLDEIEAPFGPRPDTRALIVRGDSMLPELGDADFVLYRDIAQRVEDLVGRRCVVRLDDGRVLVKRLRRGTTYGTYTLDSTNAAPIEDVTVVQAAKVEGVVFR